MKNHNKSKKIFLLYSLIGLGFLIFLSVMLMTVLKQRDVPSLYAKYTSKAERGNIITADGFHVATTQKLYKAMIDTRYLDPKKKELFIQLFSIYADMSPDEIKERINRRRGVVVISYEIMEKQAQYLKKLARELRHYDVFMELKNPKTGIKSIHGLSIIESGESREYPYDDALTPIIGYPHKVESDGFTRIKGVKGLEKRFESELQSRQDGESFGPRDVNSYIIYNKDSFTKPAIDGLDIKLTIPLSLQIRLEKMLDSMKEELGAKEVFLALMESKTGRLLSLASSNRFLPKDIKKSDYPSLNASVIEYSFEPGSVIKTLTFSLLLDKNLINPYDLVNAHNGRFKIGRKVITDEHRFGWISAENVIVHSSNVGIAQLAQKLSGVEFHEGLLKFGLTKRSTYDLIYEKYGSIPSSRELENEIYKATASYGYGLEVNLMQLIRAYNTFNNNGKMIYPKLIDSFIDERGNVTNIPQEEPIQVIKSSTAQRVHQVLIKTVNEGTGTKTKTEGLSIGGKTGTAHRVKSGEYVNLYNTTFAGFVNDNEHKYTMGVVVREPKKSQFASQTAVPVFKKAVDILVEEGYLQPNVVK